FVELVLPLFILLGRRARIVAFFGFVGLQALIASTGNYCFFNLLSFALCLSLLDDTTLSRFLPRRLRPQEAQERLAEPRAKGPVLALAAVLVLSLSTIEFSAQLGGRSLVPSFVRRGVSMLSPLRIANTYGLFAVMT